MIYSTFLNHIVFFFIYYQDRQGWMERSVITPRKTRWISLSELTQGESQTLKWSRSVLPQCVTELASKVHLLSWFILLNKNIIKKNHISYYSEDDDRKLKFYNMNKLSKGTVHGTEKQVVKLNSSFYCHSICCTLELWYHLEYCINRCCSMCDLAG